MSKKLSRDQYDELDRALSDVQDAESSGRVGTHAILIATLAKLNHVIFSVDAAIKKANELLWQGWSDPNE